MTMFMNPWTAWVSSLTDVEIQDRLTYLESLPEPLDHTDRVVRLVLGTRQLLREVSSLDTDQKESDIFDEIPLRNTQWLYYVWPDSTTQLSCPKCSRVPTAHDTPADTMRSYSATGWAGTIISWTCDGTIYTRKARFGTRI